MAVYTADFFKYLKPAFLLRIQRVFVAADKFVEFGVWRDEGFFEIYQLTPPG